MMRTYAVCVCAISTNILFKFMYGNVNIFCIHGQLGNLYIVMFQQYLCLLSLSLYMYAIYCTFIFFRIHILPAEVPLSYQAESGERIRNSFSR